MKKSLIKLWINVLFVWCKKQKIENMAADVARRCRADLSQWIIRNSKTMPPDQMRGYVRAYATYCIEAAIKQHIDIRHLTPTQIFQVILQSKEFLIEMVAGDMRSMPPAVVGNIASAA